jgi:acetylornithine aminotransferase
MILIASHIQPWHGMLGTTFGGNHLACAASLAVLEVIEQENLMANAAQLGDWLIAELQSIPQVKEVRGMGLMLGMSFDFPVAELRKNLLFGNKIFTGSAGDKNTMRLLPSLAVTKEELNQFLEALKIELNK